MYCDRMVLKLPRSVIVLGLVSFFDDLASEIVVPLIPILLAGARAAGPIALGLVEELIARVKELAAFRTHRSCR